MNAGDLKNRRRFDALAYAVASTLALAQQAWSADAPAKDDEVIDRVIVTAQKKEEDLIDVPIAVSAFDDTALARRQIDQATDLQLNVPNIAYSKTNFTSSNFQIRGIGVSSVGASSDSGVETHFNFMPIRNPRLFETEYFDVERVEVLRGPQGTLYGRNATGGAVNVIPKKPTTDDLGGTLELEAGNFGELKAKGAINLPLGDTFAARFSGIAYQRDGYVKNLATGNDVDGRDQWAARGALRWAPSADTDLTLTVNYYKEDSTRSRVGRQMCHRDPTGALGCLPDKLANEAQNARATLGGLYGELIPVISDPGNGSVARLALIPLGVDINQGTLVPSDPWQINAEFDPKYEADETIATLEFVHDFGSLSLTSITGYQETSFVSRTDFNQAVPAQGYAAGGLALFGGSIPLSEISDPTYRGSQGGLVLGRFSTSTGYDQSDQKAHQWSQELRLASNFDGALNFQLGAFYLDSDDAENYYVATTELDYGAALASLSPPYYSNVTPEASLKSTAVFGEAYWQMTDTFKWTAGLRWTQDKKGIIDRQMLFAVPLGAPLPGFRHDETTFEESTGRFGFDWKPGWFDDSTVYAFYSRGYKAGGFNPPAQGNVALQSVPPVYDPEFVDAFEVGSKNVFAGGRVQANLSAFYYKYDGLQVSKIVARTSVNENVDADIYGFEGEFVFKPTDNLLLDANFAYLNTKINEFSSIDPRDVSGGNPNFVTIKDIPTGANYVLPAAELQAAIANQLVLPLTLGGPFGIFGLPTLPPTPFHVSDGVAENLDGNQLAGSPEWSFKVGGQYTFTFGNGMELTPRVDYYWRDDFFARIFNKPIDRIEAWDVVNAQVDLSSPNASWYLRGYVNNVMDDDNITGAYLTDASAGLFTNTFSLEPRTYGVAFGLRF